MGPTVKAAAALHAPQSHEEAAAMIAEYGAQLRQLDRIEIEMNEGIANLKNAAVMTAAPFRERTEELFALIKLYCEANRRALTAGGKTKTADFTVGKVAWRWNTMAVKTSGKMEDIIASIKAAGEPMAAFLRPSIEIDKVQMLRHPVLAKTIDGVEIVEGIETFEVKPDSAKLPEAKPEAEQ
jgi:phage host-nuclease inhibitor protein Gam